MDTHQHAQKPFSRAAIPLFAQTGKETIEIQSNAHPPPG